MAEKTLLEQLYPEGPVAAFGEIERAPVGYEPAPSKPTLLELYYPEGPVGQVSATGEQMREEAAIGAAQGAVRGTGSMAAALAGGKAVARAAAPLAATHPIAYGTTVAIGALGSAVLGNMAAEPLEKELFPAVAREDLIPYREGGITFGETISAAPFAFGLPVSNANRVSRILSSLGETARKNPKAYLIGETGAGVTAGIAGGATLAYDPNSTFKRMGAEVVGGMLNPTRVIANGIPKIREALTSLKG